MTNNFIAEYNELKKIQEAYDSAATEAEKDKARLSRRELTERINDKGSDYADFFWRFERSWSVGNNYIDFSEVIADKDVPSIVSTLKSLGFRKFTLSSTWSSVVETAWLFTKNNCSLDGMVEINIFFCMVLRHFAHVAFFRNARKRNPSISARHTAPHTGAVAEHFLYT